MSDVRITGLEIADRRLNVAYEQDERPTVDYVRAMMDSAPKMHGQAAWSYRGSVPNIQVHQWMIEFGGVPGTPGWHREFNKFCIRKLQDIDYRKLRGHAA